MSLIDGAFWFAWYMVEGKCENPSERPKGGSSSTLTAATAPLHAASAQNFTSLSLSLSFSLSFSLSPLHFISYSFPFLFTFPSSS